MSHPSPKSYLGNGSYSLITADSGQVDFGSIRPLRLEIAFVISQIATVLDIHT
jgi:hypothetical protein